MSNFDREAMLEMFIYEMMQLIEQLENNTIQSDEIYSKDTINEIFRIMHTIKGSASMMLFTNISTTAHATEDLFFYIRENNPKNVDYSIVTDLVLEVVDFIKNELEKIENGDQIEENSEELNNKIKNFVKEIKNEANIEENNNNKIENKTNIEENNNSKIENKANIKEDNNNMAIENTEEKNTTFNKNCENEENIKKYFAKIFFEENSGMENVRVYNIIKNLEKIAFNITSYPENILEEKSLDIICKEGVNIKFESKYSYEYIKDTILKVFYIKTLNLETIENNKENNLEERKDFSHEYDIEIYFEEDSQMENIRAYAVIKNLQDISTKLNYEPKELFNEESLYKIKNEGIKINITTSKNYEEIEKFLSKSIYIKDLSIIETTYIKDENIIEKEILKENIENNIIKNNENIKEEDTVKNNIENIIKENIISKKDIDEKKEYIKKCEKNTSKDENKQLEEENKKQNNKDIKENSKIKKNSVHAISVSVQKLDQLLNLVGELVISEAMVTQNKDLEGLELDNFTKEARQLHKIIKDIQDTVMSMRMVPLSPTFFKMHRIVRDMCRQLKKEVQLEVIGEETEVDKNIIEHISDPLMHIIRNSVDHGIEMPDVRKSAGKQEKGTVTLEAKNSGGDVLIIIRDDGSGFNKEEILKKAKKQGLLVKPEEDYTDKEIFQFIFLPGFSTKDKVTSFSGRGVGMDVVATNIEIVGGSVIADSIKGEGSVFTLKIPLTLAIIEGMLINVGNSKFTIPIVSIKRSFKANKKDIIIDPNGNEMILVRGECYNLLKLKEYFNIEGKDDLEEGIILMIENENQTICVFADELIGEQQVVVKNIPKYIKKIKGISGCTLLGNGDISLIIDISSFFYR